MTEFAEHILRLPESKWETDRAKFVLYNNDHRVSDLRQYGLPTAMRQILFNKSKFLLDLNGNHLLNAFIGLDTGNDKCMYLTPCHWPLTTWTKHVSPRFIFFPLPLC